MPSKVLIFDESSGAFSGVVDTGVAVRETDGVANSEDDAEDGAIWGVGASVADGRFVMTSRVFGGLIDIWSKLRDVGELALAAAIVVL